MVPASSVAVSPRMTPSKSPNPDRRRRLPFSTSKSSVYTPLTLIYTDRDPKIASELEDLDIPIRQAVIEKLPPISYREVPPVEWSADVPAPVGWRRPESYVRYTFRGGPDAEDSDLEATVDYDMDEEDERWLQEFNQSRVIKVSGSQFEAVMDRLEKAAFRVDRNQHSTLRQMAIDESDDVCAVCGDGVSEDANQIVYCLAEDHEILTDGGFESLEDVRRRGSETLVASYDAVGRRIVYERPSRIIVNGRRAQRLVEFGRADQDVSLLVTPEHRMLVRARKAGGTGEWSGEFGKVEAGVIAEADRGTQFQMVTAASKGAPAEREACRALLARLGSGSCSTLCRTTAQRDDLVRLCLHAGLSPSCKSLASRLWSVSWQEDSLPVFESRRDVRMVTYVGRTWCVTVPHGHIFVRRACHNGPSPYVSRPVVTGNCDGCDMAIHQQCFGIRYIPEGSWRCLRCRSTTPVRCVLCHDRSPGGDMKLTLAGEWVHIVCALWIHEARLTYIPGPGVIEYLDTIDTSPIPKANFDAVCGLCHEAGGACARCCEPGCDFWCHVRCARTAKLRMRCTVPDNSHERDGPCLTPNPERRAKVMSVAPAPCSNGTFRIWCPAHKSQVGRPPKCPRFPGMLSPQPPGTPGTDGGEAAGSTQHAKRRYKHHKAWTRPHKAKPQGCLALEAPLSPETRTVGTTTDPDQPCVTVEASLADPSTPLCSAAVAVSDGPVAAVLPSANVVPKEESAKEDAEQAQADGEEEQEEQQEEQEEEEEEEEPAEPVVVVRTPKPPRQPQGKGTYYCCCGMMFSSSQAKAGHCQHCAEYQEQVRSLGRDTKKSHKKDPSKSRKKKSHKKQKESDQRRHRKSSVPKSDSAADTPAPESPVAEVEKTGVPLYVSVPPPAVEEPEEDDKEKGAQEDTDPASALDRATREAVQSYAGVTLKRILSKVRDVSKEFVEAIFPYWVRKRTARSHVPLLKRFDPSIMMLCHPMLRRNPNLRNDWFAYNRMAELRLDLERLRNIFEVVVKRERCKLELAVVETKLFETSALSHLQREMLRAVDFMMRSDKEGIFAHPVTPEEAPTYADVISHPMDLGTMTKKIYHNEYPSWRELASDLELVCTNATTFNPPRSVFYKAAKALLRVGTAVIAALFDESYRPEGLGSAVLPHVKIQPLPPPVETPVVPVSDAPVVPSPSIEQEVPQPASPMVEEEVVEAPAPAPQRPPRRVVIPDMFLRKPRKTTIAVPEKKETEPPPPPPPEEVSEDVVEPEREQEDEKACGDEGAERKEVGVTENATEEGKKPLYDYDHRPEADEAEEGEPLEPPPFDRFLPLSLVVEVDEEESVAKEEDVVAQTEQEDDEEEEELVVDDHTSSEEIEEDVEEQPVVKRGRTRTRRTAPKVVSVEDEDEEDEEEQQQVSAEANDAEDDGDVVFHSESEMVTDDE